jgi:hypothetical protein
MQKAARLSPTNVRIGTTPGGSEIMSCRRRPGTASALDRYWERWVCAALAACCPRTAFTIGVCKLWMPVNNRVPVRFRSLVHPIIIQRFRDSRMWELPGMGATVQAMTIGDTDSSASTLTLSALCSNITLVPTDQYCLWRFGLESNRLSFCLRQAPVAFAFISVVVTRCHGPERPRILSAGSRVLSPTWLPLYSGGNGTPTCSLDFDNDRQPRPVPRAGIIYRNNGGLNFSSVTAIPAGQRHGVVWGRLRPRWRPRPLRWRAPDRPRIYRNDGGTFVDSGAVLPERGQCRIAWGDFDNDGDLDCSIWATAKLYRNDGHPRICGRECRPAALGEFQRRIRRF